MSIEKEYCGFITIVGRPNVGKSTLLNSLLKDRISITSHKAQTTRYCIVGVHTEGLYQAIYIDTPGINTKEKRAINKLMNKIAITSIDEVDLVIFVVESMRWIPDDEIVLNKLRNSKKKVILAVNKIDKVQKKTNLLPYLQRLNSQMNFLDIVPISGKTGININVIANVVHKNLPQSTHIFSKENITDHSKIFIISEIIREKLMRFLNAELPYLLTVKIEHFQRNNNGNYDIVGLIIVDHERQKKIVIGNKGVKIKTISIEARKDIQAILKVQVYLKLWVKVRSGWTDSNYALRNLNYVENSSF